MNQPWAHICSPSRTLLPPPSPSHPPGSTQCTSSEYPVSCIKPGPAIRITYDNIHISMLPSQIIPPSPGEDSWVPWTTRRSNQSILKEINPEYSLEDWSSNTLVTWCKELPHWKRSWCWETLKAGGKGVREEDMMVEWHHWLSGHEFKQTPGDGEGQGSPVCCSPWGCKESDTT